MLVAYFADKCSRFCFIFFVVVAFFSFKFCFCVQVNKDYIALEKEVKEIHTKLALNHGGAEMQERAKPKPRVS